jgi:hypothetical protein
MLQERDIERGDNCFGGAPGTVNCFGGALGTVDCSGGASGTVDFFEGILGLIVWEELQASSIFVFFGV